MRLDPLPRPPAPVTLDQEALRKDSKETRPRRSDVGEEDEEDEGVNHTRHMQSGAEQHAAESGDEADLQRADERWR